MLNFYSTNHEIAKGRTKIGKGKKSDGDTIPEHLPQAWQTLLEKGLLVAHLFLLLMAHYRCTTINTPLVTNSNGAPLVRH